MSNEQRTLNASVTKDLVLAKAESYAHEVYKLSKKLPREELFGLTSQLRRSAISVPLNIVEGYARQSRKSQLQFLKISYGSLKEAQFILRFACDEELLITEDIRAANEIGEEAARLIWKKCQTLEGQNTK